MSYLVNPYMVTAGGATYTNVDNLIFYAQWDESSGDIINQATAKGSSSSLGNDADIVITGATYSQTGIIDEALSFDGTNDLGGFGDSDYKDAFAFVHGTGDWTFNFWLNLTTFGASECLFSNHDPTEQAGFSMRLGNNSSQLGLGITSAAGTFMCNNDEDLAEEFTTGEWHMVTWTCDYSDASDCYECFVDGVSQFTVARVNNGSATTPEYSTKTMVRGNGTSLFVNGLQDETSIWQRILSDEDITELYNSGAGLVIDGT